MAETINAILESMLPHLEELQQVGIFEETEIRGIIKRRRQMEYKLFRRPPNKEDYLKAIEYETNLDKLRKLRKERLGVVTNKDGEFGIADRIHGLYRRATKRFKGDVNLWINHIKYACKLNQYSMVGRLYGKALAIHPTNIGLLIMAAKFEFEDRQDTSAARVLFQEGLRTNSSSQKLWLEYYRMELMAVDKMKKRKNVLVLNKEELPPDDVMNYGISSVVYNEAIKAISNDVSFRLSFLHVLSLFEDTEEKEQEIFDNLLSDFPNSAIRLDAVAKRNWLRFSDTNCSHVSAHVQELDRETDYLYIEGINQLNQCSYIDEELKLWEKYIYWVIERLQYWTEKGQKNSVFGNPSKLLDICSKGKLTQTLVINIISVLQANGLHGAACDVAKQGITLYPSSSELWKQRLTCELFSVDDFSKLMSLCKQAIKVVPQESSSQFWAFLINQAILRQVETESIESLFQECFECTGNDEDILLLYLNWSHITKGIDHIRSFYKSYLLGVNSSNQKRIVSKGYPSVIVYLKIVEHELSEETVNVSRLHDLFEEAIYHHGTSSTELWLCYISILTRLGGESIKEVGKIYWRAIRTLDGRLTAQFMSAHNGLVVI